MNLPLHPGDLRELVERRSDWDDVTDVDLRVQHLLHPLYAIEPNGDVALVERYPTLHAIGLGPQLAELERICAESQRGKHAGETILAVELRHHTAKAISHVYHRGEVDGRDAESGARHLIHAAARLLMAAACADAEGRP